ncbi:transmembrane protein [Ceratobasidium sp. AG-Ba]|nr:transmembrane protein [Ceratobasidium sp. AG-Ba]
MMKAFSIRRNKQSSTDAPAKKASDSATITTEDPLSTSQRSVYGSVMSGSRSRNRLHKAHRSLDETNDPSGQVPNGDVIKRPHRKLVKKSRQHQRSDSSPEETGSITPPEQKPHSTSLPSTLGRHSMDQPGQGWSDNEAIVPSRGRTRFASMRHSVGSSADVLLTPIRGSTAISDDFVFLPTGRVVEASGPDEIVASPDSERPESPDPTIATLVTESETHHEVEHESGVKPGDLDTAIEATTLGATSSGPGSEHEDSTISQSRSSLAETRTLQEPAPPSVNVTPASPLEEAAPVVPPKESLPPVVNVIDVVKCPAPKGPPTQVRPALTARQSSKSSAKTNGVHNIVPFPGKPELGPWHATLMQSEVDHQESFDSPETTAVYWVLAIWRTLVGIMTLAMECGRWLARKGLRNDFRSWMSYWFLRELTLGFAIPLLLAIAALRSFYRLVYPHYDLTPMTA